MSNLGNTVDCGDWIEGSPGLSRTALYFHFVVLADVSVGFVA